METIGIFKFRVQEKENGKFQNFSFNTPNQIVINFDDNIVSKQISGKTTDDDESVEPKDDDDMIIDGSEEDDEKEKEDEDNKDDDDIKDEEVDTAHQVFILNNGTAFLESIRFVQSSKNVEKFVKLLYAGKLPKMTYEQIYQFHTQVEEENSTPLGIPAATRAAIIAELCRSRKNTRKPYRMTLKIEDKNKTNYKLVPIKSLPDMVSTFSGLTFENVNKSLVYAISNTKDGKPEVITPIEKIVINKD